MQLSAQPRAKQQLDASKAAFITTRMNLDVETAQKFWPVYNKLQQEIKSIRQQARQDQKSSPAEMSDDELRLAMKNRFEREQRELDLRKKYHAEFERLLSVRQISTLYRAEEEFKREVVREIRRRR